MRADSSSKPYNFFAPSPIASISLILIISIPPNESSRSEDLPPVTPNTSTFVIGNSRSKSIFSIRLVVIFSLEDGTVKYLTEFSENIATSVFEIPKSKAASIIYLCRL